MSSTPPPPDDLPEPDGTPVEGLAPPSFAPPSFPPPAPPGGWIQPVADAPLPPPPQPDAPGGYGPGGYGPGGYGAYQAYQPGVTPGRGSYAGFWARFGANLIDSLIVGIVPGIIQFIGVMSAGDVCTTSNSFGGSSTYCQFDLLKAGPLLLVALAVYVLLAFFVIVRPIGLTGQSVGGRATNVRVVDSSTGQPIGVGRAFGRLVAAMFLSGWCCNLGYLWMLWDDRKQTWHDKLTSSIVVTA